MKVKYQKISIFIFEKHSRSYGSENEYATDLKRFSLE